MTAADKMKASEIDKEIARLRDKKRRLKTNCKCVGVWSPITMSCASRYESTCASCGTHNVHRH